MFLAHVPRKKKVQYAIGSPILRLLAPPVVPVFRATGNNPICKPTAWSDGSQFALCFNPSEGHPRRLRLSLNSPREIPSLPVINSLIETDPSRLESNFYPTPD